MDVPGPSRRRCREDIPSSARNVRARRPVPDLAASRRRRREEAAAATLAARRVFLSLEQQLLFHLKILPLLLKILPLLLHDVTLSSVSSAQTTEIYLTYAFSYIYDLGGPYL